MKRLALALLSLLLPAQTTHAAEGTTPSLEDFLAGTTYPGFKEVYPYHADKQRAELVVSKSVELQQGLSTVEVRDLLGPPDEINPTCATKGCKEKVGFSYVYLVRRLKESGSVDELQEQLLRVHFDLTGKVSWAYGVDIPGFDELPKVATDGGSAPPSAAPTQGD